MRIELDMGMQTLIVATIVFVAWFVILDLQSHVKNRSLFRPFPAWGRPTFQYGIYPDLNIADILSNGQQRHSMRNLTIYQIISALPSTSVLATLFADLPAIRTMLNSTASNLTLFAPSDNAFSKHPKQSITNDISRYHVVPYPFTLALFLATGITTLPSFLYPKRLNGPQRFTFRFDMSALQFKLNSVSGITDFDIPASNGIIHIIDSLLRPPSSTFEFIAELPSHRYGRVQSFISRVNLGDILDQARGSGKGGTIFLPTDQAWERMDSDVLDFLATEDGLKYLGPLLKHHVVSNLTLYSNYFYDSSTENDTGSGVGRPRFIPWGRRHFDLPTLLEKAVLPVDVWRVGKVILMKVVTSTAFPVMDGITDDGVVHSLGNVLMPPCTNGGAWSRGLAEFKECLMGYT